MVSAQVAKGKVGGRWVGRLTKPTVARIYAVYQRQLRRLNLADFGDLILWPVTAMGTDATLRRRWATQFDAVVADEFQDTSRAQCRLLVQLAGASPLLVAGDDDQAIYGWRNADVGVFKRLIKDTNCKIIKLKRSYRSTKTIRDTASAVIDVNADRFKKAITGTSEPGYPVILIEGIDHAEEAAKVVAAIIDLHDCSGASWSDSAVLFRTRRIAKAIVQELDRRNVPFTVAGATPFARQPEVLDMLAYLQLVAAPDDRASDHAFERIANTLRTGGCLRCGSTDRPAEEGQCLN